MHFRWMHNESSRVPMGLQTGSNTLVTTALRLCQTRSTFRRWPRVNYGSTWRPELRMTRARFNLSAIETKDQDVSLYVVAGHSTFFIP